jgi:hypothetical protein
MSMHLANCSLLDNEYSSIWQCDYPCLQSHVKRRAFHEAWIHWLTWEA